MPTLAKPQMWWPGINRQHPLARGLVAAWPFWEGAGSKVQDVVAGNGSLDGTLTNMDPATDWVMSPYGWALDCKTAGDDYVNFGTRLTYSRTQITVACWVWIKSDNAIFRYVVAQGAAADRNWALQLSNPATTIDFWLQIGDVPEVATFPNYGQDQWIHLVGTYDGTTVRIFVNGAEGTPHAATGTIDSDPLNTTLGARSAGDINCGLKTVSVSIHDRCLAPSEIADLYAKPHALYQLEPEVFLAAAAPPGVAPTSHLYGSLVGPLGGAI